MHMYLKKNLNLKHLKKYKRKTLIGLAFNAL